MVEAQPLEEELAPPDSDVEHISYGDLETRNENRIPVPLEVKTRFLRMCDAACRRRMEQHFGRRRRRSSMETDNDIDRSDNDAIDYSQSRKSSCPNTPSPAYSASTSYASATASASRWKAGTDPLDCGTASRPTLASPAMARC